MKKLRILALFLAAALAVLPLSGCGGVEQTNEGLTIYLSATTKDYLVQIASGFQNYFDIPVELVDLSDVPEEEFTRRLSEELMNGKGPDIFLLGEDFMRQRDVYKMMRSGVFADVSSMLDSYPDMEWETFNRAVMEQGVLDGKRYLMPINYRIPVLLTSKGILEESGFQVERCSNFEGFLHEAEPFVEARGNDSMAPRLFGSGMAFRDYPIWMGSGIFDYKNRTVEIDTPEFRAAAEFYRALYPQEQEGPTDLRKLFERWPLDQNRGRLFENYEAYIASLPYSAAYLQAHDEPVALPLRGLDGGVHAIISQAFAVNSNSPNQENASKFIYWALLRYQYVSMLRDIPVRNPFIADTLNSVFDEGMVLSYYYFLTDETGEKRLLEGYRSDFQPIDRAFVEEFVSWAENAASASFPTAGWTRLEELMTPYYKGEADYETCVKKAQEQLALYLTE